MLEAYRYCEQLVRSVDRDRYLSSLFAPAQQRRALHALYAFDIETARVRTLARQPLPGEIRLQWWREVLRGERDGEAAANPVSAALLDAVTRAELSREPFLSLLDAREFDLYEDPMPTSAALEAYAQAAAFVLSPGGGAHSPELADAIGAALTICASLRNFALHASRRQLYVPTDVLEDHGVHIDDVYAGRTTPALLAALREMRQRTRRHVQHTEALRSVAPPEAMPAFLPAAPVPLYLDRMDHRDYDPFKTIVDVPQWRRQWVLWRSARQMTAQLSGGARLTS
jgi:15-cis-phytoene synthase